MLPDRWSFRWRSSLARRALREAALRILATRAPRPNGLVHIYFHEVPPPQAAKFEELLARLQKLGPFVGPSDADSPGSLNSSVRFAVSFDDGYADNYEVAAPILKARGIPATVFVATGFLGLEGQALQRFARHHLCLEHSPRPLTPSMVRELALYGVRVGGHSVTHRRFCELASEDAHDELRRCKHELEDLCGYSVTDFAWPFGSSRDFNSTHVTLALEAGYKRVYSGISRRKRHMQVPGTWPRRHLSLDWDMSVLFYLSVTG